MRLLFVTHTASLGGAANSLRALIRAYEGVEADLVVPRFHATPGDAAIRAFFGPRVRRIFRCWLPFEHVYRGPPPISGSLRSRFLFPWTWRATRSRFLRFLKEEQYDAIHLNSVVLHAILRDDLPFLFHVREIVARPHVPRVRASAARARGVVFIDEATRAPFEGAPLQASVVLNNPVDMTGVGRPPPDVAARLGGDPSRLTIVALVGVLSEEKGAAFAVQAFRQVRREDVRLLLVGRGAPRFERRLERLAGGDRRIVFWGLEREIDRVYAMADYVLRAEPYACVGRTIYEALYAGCGVIVPGDPTRHALFEYDRFRERIHFYPPRDGDRLRALLEPPAGRKIVGRQGASNVAAYVAQFDRFMRDALRIT